MLRWLKRLFHHHEWQTFNKVQLVDKGLGRTGTRFQQRCVICQKIRKIDLI